MRPELTDPAMWLSGPRRDEAVHNLIRYMTIYTGRFFEPLADQSDPNRFEASDIVAVSCLSVVVPPDASAWLLIGDGRDRTAQLLSAMDVGRTVSLREHDLANNAAAVELWRVLSDQAGLGPTIVSKLMAAKRPHLIPIYDSYVAAALLPQRSRRYWAWWGPWRDLMTGPASERLCTAIDDVRHAAIPTIADARHLSDLRVLDIVVWSAEQQRRRPNR